MLWSLILWLGLTSSLPLPTEHSYVDGSTHPEQRLLFVPAAAEDAPVLAYFHGGAWLFGSKEGYFPAAQSLAERGISVALVAYRLSGKEGDVRHPDHLHDAAAALRWLQARHKRVYLMGHSAGAHLVAHLGLDEKAGPIEGIITTEGIFDLRKLEHDFRAQDYAQWFLNAAFGEDQTKWDAASPQFQPVTAKRRWLLVHSEGDTLVNLAQSKNFEEKLRAAQAPVELKVLQGLEHDTVPGSITDDVLRFIRPLEN